MLLVETISLKKKVSVKIDTFNLLFFNNKGAHDFLVTILLDVCSLLILHI